MGRSGERASRFGFVVELEGAGRTVVVVVVAGEGLGFSGRNVGKGM